MAQVTILVPTMNEEQTIEQFIRWCHLGFQSAGVEGEIVIVDKSNDSTASIAQKLGAIVLPQSGSGVGNAYQQGLKFVSGKYILIGDADCTYDFRSISNTLHALNSGYDFVLGSRFRGSMEKGSMPLHHKYFGTPLTTLIFNLIHGTRWSDIHSGYRAFPNKVAKSLIPSESGWQYASEMLARVRHSRLNAIEIPIDFLCAPNERISHLKRNGWMTPFKEGLRAVGTAIKYGSDRILKLLSIAMLLVSTPIFFLDLIGYTKLFSISISWGATLFSTSVLLFGIVLNSLRKFFEFLYIGNSEMFGDVERRLRLALNFLLAYTLFFVIFLMVYLFATINPIEHSSLISILSTSIAPILVVGGVIWSNVILLSVVHYTKTFWIRSEMGRFE